MSEEYVVYTLYSQKFDQIYVGYTSNLIDRVANYYIQANTDTRPIFEVRQLYDYLLKDCKKQGFLGLNESLSVPFEPTLTRGNDMHALLNEVIRPRI